MSVPQRWSALSEVKRRSGWPARLRPRTQDRAGNLGGSLDTRDPVGKDFN